MKGQYLKLNRKTKLINFIFLVFLIYLKFISICKGHFKSGNKNKFKNKHPNK
jgi:preprotein translocase subunit SecG